MDLLHKPHTLVPCGHVFCQMCLMKLSYHQPRHTACPMCRGCIQDCLPNGDLDSSIKNRNRNLYDRQEDKLAEMKQLNYRLPNCSTSLDASTSSCSFSNRKQTWWLRFLLQMLIIILLIPFRLSLSILMLICDGLERVLPSRCPSPIVVFEYAYYYYCQLTQHLNVLTEV